MTPFNPDTDGDGIGDGAEAKFVVALLDASGMALNLSLIGAVLHSRDYDNDGIPTSVELQYHLNPYDASDANGDLDHDGLSNLFEYEHNMSINDADSDHDGINDGDELSYWESRLSTMHPGWSAEQVLNMSVNYTLNPDVDNDSIPDGKEIKGYTVKIITGWDSKGEPMEMSMLGVAFSVLSLVLVIVEYHYRKICCDD